MRTDVSDEKEPSFKKPKGRFWTVGRSKARPAELTWHVQETGFTEVHGISKGVLGVGGTIRQGVRSQEKPGYVGPYKLWVCFISFRVQSTVRFSCTLFTRCFKWQSPHSNHACLIQPISPDQNKKILSLY